MKKTKHEVSLSQSYRDRPLIDLGLAKGRHILKKKDTESYKYTSLVC